MAGENHSLTQILGAPKSIKPPDQRLSPSGLKGCRSASQGRTDRQTAQGPTIKLVLLLRKLAIVFIFFLLDFPFSFGLFLCTCTSHTAQQKSVNEHLGWPSKPYHNATKGQVASKHTLTEQPRGPGVRGSLFLLDCLPSEPNHSSSPLPTLT